MSKYELSAPDDDCSTRFIERDGSNLTCPYYHHPTKESPKGEANCGDWCPLFEFIPEGDKVQLHCGSGNAEYSLKEE